MGAAARAATPTTSKHISPHQDPRPPLIPSEKDNAAPLRRSRAISSRYLSYSSPSSSSSSSARSHSVGRTRPDLDLDPAPSRPISTTTRSLAVSFQGESFFYQTSKAKPSPERRPRATTPTRTLKPAPAPDHDNSRPLERWPAARPRQFPLIKEPIVATVHLLHQLDNGSLHLTSFDGGDLSPSSDTDSGSSGSNSSTIELSVPPQPRPAPRGICVPARFWPETNTRRQLLDPATPKLIPVKKSLLENQVSSPRSVCSPLRQSGWPSSPSKVADARSRGAASPLRVRSIALTNAFVADQPGNAPSIISFAAEVRRAKKGENRIEDAHMLRLLHNRQLQWRFVNARVTAALVTQRLVVEKILYNAWITSSAMRDSVIIKRIKLHQLTQNLKLTTLLKGQMSFLEEWSLVERDHSSSLSGSNEALKASILRLPVVGGARADMQEVEDAVGSAVDVMQAMGSSICSLLSKAEGTSSLVFELAKVAAQERALLDQSREFLSRIATMHVKQCSLRGHILQLKTQP